jgi:hypothetical protein
MMKKSETSKKDSPTLPTAAYKKIIAKHRMAAKHFEAAAQNHQAAAKHHENGNEKKAAKCTLQAYGHSYIANEAQKENL